VRDELCAWFGAAAIVLVRPAWKTAARRSKTTTGNEKDLFLLIVLCLSVRRCEKLLCRVISCPSVETRDFRRARQQAAAKEGASLVFAKLGSPSLVQLQGFRFFHTSRRASLRTPKAALTTGREPLFNLSHPARSILQRS
jgi:hypothetical protein